MKGHYIMTKQEVIPRMENCRTIQKSIDVIQYTLGVKVEGKKKHKWNRGL